MFLDSSKNNHDDDSPFYSYEHDQDPIMVAARLRKYNYHETTITDEHLSSPPLNLIALGRTGDGKSSLLNDLIGHEVFKQKRAVKSQTKEIQTHTGFWAPLHPHIPHKEDFGCKIHVIDTPGFGDSQMRDNTFFHNIQQAILNAAVHEGGVHCFLMVFKITANADTVFKGIESLYNLVSSYDQAFWKNVLLVFTHVDLVKGSATRYDTHKMALKKLVYKLKEKYNMVHELPMIWISTHKFTCQLIKGIGECDCERGNRYHADCRRRLFEQVWKRRNSPFTLTKERVYSSKEE